MSRSEPSARARSIRPTERVGRAGPRSASRAATARELDAEQVRWTCDPIASSTRRPKVTKLLGQPRAMTALRTGLELYAPGYNIFVSGLLGSGRTRVVQHLIEELMPPCRLRPDRVFVHNFREPNKPRLLTLPRGQGTRFRDDVVDLVFGLREALREALHSRRHKSSRRLVVQAAEERQQRLFKALSREASRKNCALVEYRDSQEVSADILPVHDGEPRSLEDLESLARKGDLTAAEREALLRVREDLVERLEELSERIQRLHRQTEAELRAMDRRVALRAIQPLLAEFARTWPEPGVVEHLHGLQEEIAADLGRWLAEEDGDEAHPESESTRAAATTPALSARFRDLQVMVLDSEEGDGCPVVVESNPTYNNLFGTIEPAHDGGRSPLGRIHVGSLLRADGGYLIVRATDVLAEPGVWQQLKRALKAARVEVREYDPSAGTTAGAMQPEAIPIDLKVVLIGEPGVYEHLAHEDQQFLQLFKVHAEFDRTIPNDKHNRRRYADFLAWLADSEELGPIGPDAAGAIAEFGARVAGRQDRLSTCFGDLADVAREAAHLSGKSSIGRHHVEQALAMRDDRLALSREYLERELHDGYLLLRTSGSAIGQVNALTVLDTGTFTYGKPVRITASTGAANAEKSDVINIEREAELSGPLHDKGILILQGFLLERFGGDAPIRLMATVCFEQLYSNLDGDSASCAELYALLSSLARVPIRQGVAVTGSLNQKGDVQAVGGVNEKVEGFFRVCRQKRLTGKQGVLLPDANARDLMLAPEVVAAVEQKRFHVWTMAHVLDGLQVLTGSPAEHVLAKVRETLEQYRRGADRD